MLKKTDLPAAIASAATALALLLLVPLVSLESVAFSPAFYHSQFRALNRPQETGFPESDLMRASQALWAYFRGQKVTPQLKLPMNGKETILYGERELAHLADVRSLFQQGIKARSAAAVILTLAATYLVTRGHRGRRHLARATLVASGLTLLLMLIGLILLTTDFNRWFTLFHLVSFSNDLWQLDPARENLIRIFPEGFFFAAARSALLRAVIAFVLLFIISLTYLHRKPA